MCSRRRGSLPRARPRPCLSLAKSPRAAAAAGGKNKSPPFFCASASPSKEWKDRFPSRRDTLCDVCRVREPATHLVLMSFSRIRKSVYSNKPARERGLSGGPRQSSPRGDCPSQCFSVRSHIVARTGHALLLLLRLRQTRVGLA